MLSDLEEAEMDRARSSRFRLQGDDGSDEDQPYHHRERRRSSHHDDEARGEGMMDMHNVGSERQSGSSGFESHSRLLPDRERLGDRSGMARIPFDFGAMEEFAEKERVNQVGGNSTPKWIPNGGEDQGPRRRNGSAVVPQDREDAGPGSYDTAMNRTNTMSVYGDDHDGPAEHGDGENHDHPFSPKESESSTTHFHRRRQRKLSQSNPVMRRQGKLALFEGLGSLGGGNDAVDSSPAGFKAPRQPKNLGGPSGPGPFVPFTDAAPGHDRPYRFSFYSNAQPLTIHARSLAELPAEGQTFEDLFKGKNNEEAGGSRGQPDYGSMKNDSGAGTPVGEGTTGAGGKMSLLARAAGAANAQSGAGATRKINSGGGGGLPGNADDDPEAFTWWLDVLSPTDEEMRMLSKVILSIQLNVEADQ